MKYKKHPACLAMALMALAACSPKNPQPPKPTARDLERRLAAIAGQANQAAPANVDPETRLDGAKAGPGLLLTTTYTLVNPEAEGVNSTNFETKLTPVVKEGSCNNPELRPLIDQGVVVVLEYRGLDGKPIGTISINHDTCVAPAKSPPATPPAAPPAT